MHVDVAISGLVDVAVTIATGDTEDDSDETSLRLAGLSLDDMCARAGVLVLDTFKSAATLTAAIEQATAAVDETSE